MLTSPSRPRNDTNSAGRATGLCRHSSRKLKDVSDELREIARGIHPTILTEPGSRRHSGSRSPATVPSNVA